MTSTPRTVLVLGAGFTRAFLPQAPLLIDDFYGDDLVSKFKEFPRASHILGLERSRNPDGQINIESLMTRLDGLMPYDFGEGANEELGLLLSGIKDCFMRRLEEAKKGPIHADELAAFARYCVENGITCITFNYDDVLDKALWEVKKATHTGKPPYWHPDGGYGFFCKPSAICVSDESVYMDRTSMVLLKLHGSVNWRIRLGYSQPYPIDALVHHADWSPSVAYPELDPEVIAIHLEPKPFIVPPVLLKSALVEQPILRLVWSLAYKVLKEAEQITFVGYSLPTTDIAAFYLFREAVREQVISKVRVVNYPKDPETLRDAYRKVFPGIADEQFDIMDAREWSRDLASGKGTGHV